MCQVPVSVTVKSILYLICVENYCMNIFYYACIKIVGVSLLLSLCTASKIILKIKGLKVLYVVSLRQLECVSVIGDGHWDNNYIGVLGHGCLHFSTKLKKFGHYINRSSTYLGQNKPDKLTVWKSTLLFEKKIKRECTCI